MASSGRLARVFSLHSTSSQPCPPLMHCPMVATAVRGGHSLCLNRPHAARSLGAICLTGGFLGALAGVFSVVFAAPIRPP
jgi:hypothetical protein